MIGFRSGNEVNPLFDVMSSPNMHALISSCGLLGIELPIRGWSSIVAAKQDAQLHCVWLKRYARHAPIRIAVCKCPEDNAMARDLLASLHKNGKLLHFCSS